MDIENKNLEKTPSFFRGIVEVCLKDDGQFDFLLSWSRNYDATNEPCTNALEETIFIYFAYMHRAMPDWYE